MPASGLQKAADYFSANGAKGLLRMNLRRTFSKSPESAKTGLKRHRSCGEFEKGRRKGVNLQPPLNPLHRQEGTKNCLQAEKRVGIFGIKGEEMGWAGKKISLAIPAVLFFIVSSASATIIRVPQDQPTIQAGINAAVNGDTVAVTPGTYAEHIDFTGKSILVTSSGGPDVTTIMKVVSGVSLVKFQSNEPRAAILRGFTLTGATAVATGGAIFCGINSSPTITGNVIKNNVAGDGSGIFVEGPSFPLIERNVIIDNADDGIALTGSSTTEIINNTISNNVARGILIFGGSPNIKNNIFTNHSLGIQGVSSIQPTYNCFFSNSSGPYTGTLGIGNLLADPQFVGGIPFDYHLMVSSPCINAGDPTMAVPPQGGTRVDIGAYEFPTGPDTTFHLHFPPTGSLLFVRQPQLIWSPLRDTTSTVVNANFRVLFSTESDFANADSSPPIVDTIWKIPYKLEFGETYFWRVVAITSAQDTFITGVASFSNYIPLKAIFPEGYTPWRQPSLIWEGIHDTSVLDTYSYRVIFTSADVDTSPVLTDTSWKVPHRLPVLGGANWQVIAVSDSGDSVVSVLHSFWIREPVVKKIHPIDNQDVPLRQPTFIWQPLGDTTISDTVQYRIILKEGISATDSTISNLISDTTWKVPYKLKLNQEYYWSLNVVYTDTEFISFDTIGPNPIFYPRQDFYPLSPVNSSRIGDRQPLFVWSFISDTSVGETIFYKLLYSQNPDFSSSSSSPLITDTSWQPSSSLFLPATYYWKAFAFYGSTDDTVFPGNSFSFLLAPSKLLVTADRPTMQEAIDISLNGDTVLVESGVYQQNIFFNGKRIKLLSEAGPESTSIEKLVDGASLVSFTGSEDSTAVLRGFTLKGARLVSNGAAINVAGASPIIEDNFIQDNQGDSAVVYVLGGSPKIRRNLIAENNTGLAAIGFFGGTGGQIINNTIASNTGDGVRITPTMAMQIKNNILSSNSGYGIRSVGGINNTSAVSYNDNFSNALGTYFATIPTTGEIYQNPQFRGGNPFDYHLLPGSPCIDAGDPAFPVPPGGGARVDIGAFEFVPTLGDLNGDGIFSPADVVLELDCVFLGMGNCPFNLADMNCDSQLSASDVVLILNFVFLGIPPPC